MDLKIILLFVNILDTSHAKRLFNFDPPFVTKSNVYYLILAKTVIQQFNSTSLQQGIFGPPLLKSNYFKVIGIRERGKITFLFHKGGEGGSDTFT